MMNEGIAVYDALQGLIDSPSTSAKRRIERRIVLRIFDNTPTICIRALPRDSTTTNDSYPSPPALFESTTPTRFDILVHTRNADGALLHVGELARRRIAVTSVSATGGRLKSYCSGSIRAAAT